MVDPCNLQILSFYLIICRTSSYNSSNEKAFHQTLETGIATFWSTSRNTIWVKGETSGDYLKINNILIDCDQDALVYQVTLQGEGVCHTYNSLGKHRKACFYRQINKNKQLQFIEAMK